MRRIHRIVLIGLVAAALPSCAQQASEPPVELKPVANVQEIMESLVGHMAQEIFDAVRVEIDETGIHEFKPENDEAWQEVRWAAMGLAETANLLMLPGRAPDQGNWKKYSEALITTSLEAAKAAENHDFDGLLTAGGNVYEQACLACHEEYLDKFVAERTGQPVPTE